MDPSTLLSQLRDIQAPDSVLFWPLAPGWWILIILGLTFISGLSYLLIKARLKNKWKREASLAFKRLRFEYSQNPSSDNLFQINRLLKQAMSSARTDRNYLHKCESDWASALKTVSHKGKRILNDQEVSTLSRTLYARQSGTLDNLALDRISLWIKHLG